MAGKSVRKKSVKDQRGLSALSDDEKNKMIAAAMGELEGLKSSPSHHSKDTDFEKFLSGLRKKDERDKAKAAKERKEQAKHYVASNFMDRWDYYVSPVEAETPSEYSVYMALLKAPNTSENAPVSLCLLIHLHDVSKTIKLRAIPDIFNAKNETLRSIYDCEVSDLSGTLYMSVPNPERRLLYRVDIEQKIESGMITCNISGKIGNITLYYDYKNHILKQFDYKDFEYLSEEKEGRRQKRPREDWPDPDKPRYASVNRMDVALATRIEASTAGRLEAFLEDSGMSKKGAIVEAINRLIDAYELEHGIELKVFDLKDLSKEKKVKQHQRAKVAREDWPDPSKSRWAEVNRGKILYQSRIPEETSDRVETFLKDTGMKKVDFTDEAINRLLDDLELEYNLDNPEIE